VLLYPPDPSVSAMRAAIERTARSAGIRLQVVEVKATTQLDTTQLDRALAAVARGRSEALAVPGSAFFYYAMAYLGPKARLPAIAPWRQFAEADGLMSYGANVPELFRRAATYVDIKILKGARPGDLPVEQPARFELVVNLRAAEALGLTIPQSVLVRADETIQ
jgi:putative ABC transport system substrate-binding protein